MEAHTGYIKISRFTSGTDKEFTLALRELKRQNIDRLVLDLRDNPGGYLDKAIKVADEFIPAGRTISYTEGKASKYNSTYTSTKNGMFETGGLVVLINEGSASASEILAGALQENDRATIVGRRSFGKGLVQMPISLRDGSELRLTISRYHTPSGRCIQKPYDSKDLGLYEEDLDSRFAQGELFVEDSIHLSDTVRYKTIGGRIVYGGGGIKPDVFVPLDTTRNNLVISQMHNAFVFVGISQNYAHQYGKMIRSKGLAYYKHQFFPTTALEVEMLDRSRKEGIGLSDRRWQKVKSAAGIELKAAIARKIYGEKGFYSVLLDADADYQRAVQSFPKALVQK
jgi:carboxyl-terminal processing protease